MQETSTQTTTEIDFRKIALDICSSTKRDVYVVIKDGSYQYLNFDDDFDWNDVIYVAKPL